MPLPPDVHRLIYEALAGLGGDADPEAIAKAVRKLDHGLPAEDEFSVVCAWLGRCELIHKLDQQQTPRASREQFQVPDLMAKFTPAGPVLIEVKVCNDRTLTFKPDYHRRLTAYADMLGLPLLIAWKHHSVWTLFEFRHVALAKVNHNIQFTLAMQQNLFGVLAGDVSYCAQPGAGIHFEFAKEKLIATATEDTTVTETWQMRVKDVAFTRGGGEPTKLQPEVAQLFTTLELETEQAHRPDAIRQSFVVVEGAGMQLAHRALVSLLDWESGAGDRASWRSLLGAGEIVRSIADFKAALSKGIKEGVIRYVLHQQPTTMPTFLSRSAEEQ